MMGGLLEALFVARANLMTNKTPLFRAKATPIDSKTKKPLALPEWTLRPYIDVAAELGWISRSGKDVVPSCGIIETIFTRRRSVLTQ
jgi:hypothetical protein